MGTEEKVYSGAKYLRCTHVGVFKKLMDISSYKITVDFKGFWFYFVWSAVIFDSIFLEFVEASWSLRWDEHFQGQGDSEREWTQMLALWQGLNGLACEDSFVEFFCIFEPSKGVNRTSQLAKNHRTLRGVWILQTSTFPYMVQNPSRHCPHCLASKITVLRNEVSAPPWPLGHDMLGGHVSCWLSACFISSPPPSLACVCLVGK